MGTAEGGYLCLGDRHRTIQSRVQYGSVGGPLKDVICAFEIGTARVTRIQLVSVGLSRAPAERCYLRLGDRLRTVQ